MVNHGSNNSYWLKGAFILLNHLFIVAEDQPHPLLKSSSFPHLFDQAGFYQVAQWINAVLVFGEVDFFFKNHRTYLELDSKQTIPFCVKRFNHIEPWKKAILFHLHFVVVYLHVKRSPQVNEIGITNIRKQKIAETTRIGFPQWIKLCLPDKIYKQTELACWVNAVVTGIKMFCMNKFYMLHAAKKMFNTEWYSLNWINGMSKIMSSGIKPFSCEPLLFFRL